MNKNNDRKTVAVAGATGNCGLEVVRSAKARGLRVRVLVRNEAKLEPVKDCCDEIRTVQVTDAETLKGSLDGADYLISCLGKTFQKDKIPRRAVDVDANLNLFAEAKQAGVERAALLSVFTARLDHPVVILRMRAEAEKGLVDSTIPYVIIRPSGFFSDMWEIFKMCQKKGTLWTFGSADMKFNPISLVDLGKFMVDSLIDDTNVGKVLDVGGPEVLSPREMAEMSEKILGRKVKVKTIPLWLAKAGVFMIRPFSRDTWELAQFFVGNSDYATKHDNELVAPRTGTHRLKDYYRDRYEEEKAAE